MLGPETLKTSRLWLRLLRPGGAVAYQRAVAALVAVPEDRAHMLTFPAPFGPRHARQRIALAQRWWTQDLGWSYGLWQGPRLVGQVQIVTQGARQRSAEVAYWIGRKARGQGLAGEALTALIAAAKEHWPLEGVEATVVPDNQASIAVLTKLGFHAQGQEIVPYDLPYQWPLGLQRLHRRRRKTPLLIFTLPLDLPKNKGTSTL